MAPRKLDPHPCACGCGQQTRTGKFLPGHDQKLRTAIEQAVGGLEKLKVLVEAHLGRLVMIPEKQRETLRLLWVTHDADEEAVIKAYAAAEKAGLVPGNAASHGLSGEAYARVLLEDGRTRGWLTQPETAPSQPPIEKVSVAALRDNDRIEWLVDKNPKRPGSAAWTRFSGYLGATTVGDYLARGGTKADLKWDLEHHFLNIIPE